jgi:hypothetical protein
MNTIPETSGAFQTRFENYAMPIHPPINPSNALLPFESFKTFHVISMILQYLQRAPKRGIHIKYAVSS